MKKHGVGTTCAPSAPLAKSKARRCRRCRQFGHKATTCVRREQGTYFRLHNICGFCGSPEHRRPMCLKYWKQKP